MLAFFTPMVSVNFPPIALNMAKKKNPAPIIAPTICGGWLKTYEI